MPVLVLSDGDWGDEFDLQGFMIFRTKEDWENYEKGIPDHPKECYYGSNEFVIFQNKIDYLSYLTVKEISESEMQSILRLLNLTLPEYATGIKYGLFIPNSSNY